MNYRQTKQCAIWTFVGLNLAVEFVVNDILSMEYNDIVDNVLIMIFLTYLLGGLIWLFADPHYLSYLLTKTTLRKRDIKTIYTIVGSQRMSKNVTYSEFNEIIETVSTACLRKLLGSEEDIKKMVIATVYVTYKNLWLEKYRGMLPEIRALENEHYDFIKIVESFYNYSK